MDLGSAIVALMMVVLLKPAVMILGLRLVLRLRPAIGRAPSRSPVYAIAPEDLADARVVFWALAVFFASECMCGVEVYVVVGSSPVFSALHASLSALGMGLTGLAVARVVDRKVLRYADPGCAAARLCRGCTVQTPLGCKLRGVLELASGLAAFAAIAPFFASVKEMAADTGRWELPFPSLNAWYDAHVVPRLVATLPGYSPHGVGFSMQASELVLEYRVIPGLALALFVVAFVAARARREAVAVRVLAFGLGLVVYSLLELVLYDVTGDVILGSLGHELTELWFVVFAGEALRRTYGAEAAPPRPPQALRVLAA